MTDTQRVLQLFRKSGGKLISNSSISAGQYFGTKPILNWSARITDARDEIDCNCGQDQDTCTAVEHIRNVKKNWYRYEGLQPVAPVELPRVYVDVRQIEKQLQELRIKYASAVGLQKEIIEIQGKALRRSLEIQKSMSTNVREVMEALA